MSRSQKRRSPTVAYVTVRFGRAPATRRPSVSVRDATVRALGSSYLVRDLGGSVIGQGYFAVLTPSTARTTMSPNSSKRCAGWTGAVKITSLIELSREYLMEYLFDPPEDTCHPGTFVFVCSYVVRLLGDGLNQSCQLTQFSYLFFSDRYYRRAVTLD